MRGNFTDTDNVRIMRLHDIISLSLPIGDVILNMPKTRSDILSGRFLISNVFENIGIDSADFKLELQDGRLEINVHDKMRSIPFEIASHEDSERYAAFATAAQGDYGVTAVHPSMVLEAIHQSEGYFQIVGLTHPHFSLDPTDQDMPIIMMQAIHHTVSTIMNNHGLTHPDVDAFALMDISDKQAFIEAVVATMDETTLDRLSSMRRNGIKLVQQHDRLGEEPRDDESVVVEFPFGGRQIDS